MDDTHQAGKKRGAAPLSRSVAAPSPAVAAPSNDTYEEALRYAPQPIWVEDHSAVRLLLEERGLLARVRDPGDLSGILIADPDLLHDAVAAIRYVHVNEATVQRYGFPDHAALLAAPDQVYSDSSRRLYAQFWDRLSVGRQRFDGEDVTTTATGERIATMASYTVVAGHESSWDLVVVAETDVTDQRSAERLVLTQRDAAVALAEQPDRERLLRKLVELLVAVERVDTVAVYLPEAGGDGFARVACHGVAEDFPRRVDRRSSTAASEATGWQRRPLYLPYAELRDRLCDLPADTALPPSTLRAVALLPVQLDGALVAVIFVGSDTHDELPEAARLTLEAVAAGAAGAVARIRAEEAAADRLRYLEVLGRLQERLLADLDADIWDMALPELCHVARADRVYFFRRHVGEHGEDRYSQLAEYVAEGVQPQIGDPALQDLTATAFGKRWVTMLQRGEPVCGTRTDFGPREQAALARQGILSLLMLPLVVDGEFYGVIGLDDCRAGRRWTAAAVALLTSAAATISSALELRRSVARLHEESRRLDSLLAAARATSSSLESQEVIAHVARHTGIALGSSQCVVWEYESDTDEEIMRALWERVPKPGLAERVLGSSYRLEEAPDYAARLKAGERQQVRLSDPDIDADTARDLVQWGEKSLLSIPLMFSGKFLGELILIETERERVFTPAEVELAEALGEIAAGALRNAHLHAEAQRQLAVRHDLLQLSERLLSSLDEQQVLESISTILHDLVGCDSIEVGLVDGDEVEIVFATGKHAALGVGSRYPVGTGITRSVLASGMPESVDTMPGGPSADSVGKGDAEARASIIAPLRGGAQRRLLLMSKLGGARFREEDLETVRLFASLASVALENARLYHAAEQMAISDGLTGLYNHRHFYERLDLEIARARRSESPLALLMIDLDDFKQLNDEHGHLAGDEVLRMVGRVLNACTRYGVDLAARYGGEEFAVFLPGACLDSAASSALRVAERIRAAIAAEILDVPTDEGLLRLSVTVSVGVAVFPTTASTMGQLVAQADAALYVAKHRGKNRVEASRLRAGDA